MQSKDLRSILSLGQAFVRSTSTSRARMLASRVGKAFGLDAGMRGRLAQFETLEERKLLDGSFDSPIALPAPNGGGVIIQAGDINPAAPTTNNDTYSFTAGTSGFITVLGDTANQTPASLLNTQVQVYNSARQLIASGTNNGTLTSGTARDGWAGFVATAGQQYFVVVSSEGIGSGTYTLRVRTRNESFSMGGELPNELGIARELNSPTPNFGAAPPVLPTAILGQLGGTGAINTRLRQDEIIYRWTVPAGTAYDSLVMLNVQSTIGNVARRLDTRVDVYNSQGVLVTQDSDAGRINDAFAVFRARPGEQYFIRVRSDEITNNNIELATGPFFLVMDASAQNLPIDDMTRRGSDTGGTFLGFDDPSVAPDPAAPTPTFQSSSYSFVAEGSGLAIIVATQRGLAPVTDPALRLYDEAGTLIDFRDNSVGLAPQLSVNLEGGKRYFVIVDGFAVQNQVQYNLFIEANHTVQTGLDDHIDTPTTGNAEEIRRQLSLATALPWDDTTYVTVDAQDAQLFGSGTLVPARTALDNRLRIERDRGMRVIATGQGRIEGGNDRDLFTFTAPADMLNQNAGNNDDQGTSLFVGGRFDAGNPDSAFDIFSQNLITWDAGDYWPVGPQLENDDADFGFSNNALTPATPNAEIRAMQAFTMDLGDGLGPRSFLFVGGDFTLTLPTDQGPVTLNNFAVWAFNAQAGRYEWQTFGGADGPIFAFKQWDVPDAGGGGGGGQATPTLFIGGDFQNVFTSLGGVPANRLAAIDEDTAIFAPRAGLNGAVRALEVFESFVDDPLTPEVDPESQGERLYIGGSFTNVGAAGGANPAFRNFTSMDETGTFIATGFTPNGTVHALARHIGSIGDIEESDARLMVGGEFTNFGGFANIGIYESEAVAPADFGLAFSGPVFAMAPWNPPNINNAPDTNALLAPKIVIGGDFTVGGLDNLVLADLDEDGAGNLFFVPGDFVGTDGPVRSIVSLVDAQEPGIDATLNSGAPQQALYIGGSFTQINTANGPVFANNVAQLAAENPQPGAQPDAFVWTALEDGVGNSGDNVAPVTVFALAQYDDGNAGRWDRHSRPATRVAITVNPTFGAFFNSRVRVFDSNLQIVYGFGQIGSDTIALPFPDPSGMVDPSLTAGQPPAPGTVGITVYAGETYYVEISNYVGGDDASATPSGGTGRYTVTVIADSGPVDINGDGIREDVNATGSAEVANAGNAPAATQVLTTLGTGEGAGDRNTTQFPFPGNDITNTRVDPFLGFGFSKRGDQGLIDNINDTDLYFFRAEESGFVEIRVQTQNYIDQYADVVGTTALFANAKQVSSRLDAGLRVFDNDLEQLAYADNVSTVGANQVQYVGNFGGNATFVPARRQDPRAVVRVEAGQVYFFQVESAQRWTNPSAALPPDAGDPDNPNRRRATDPKEIDWRDAIGGYRVLINQVGELLTDFENGQFREDDFPDILDQGTVLSFDNSSRADFTGAIDDTPSRPDDVDVVQMLLPSSGQYTVTLSVTGGGLVPTANVFAGLGNGTLLGTLVPAGTGAYSATFNGAAGDLVQMVITGSGTTEGSYTVSVVGPATVDDHADANKWFNATTLTVSDHRGRVEGSGTINTFFDTDVFRFDFEAFERATFTVRSLDATLLPRVTVYEVAETTTGEAIYQRIGTGVGTRAGSNVNPAVALASLQPSRVVEVPNPGPNREYKYYYVVVEGATGSQDFGRYQLEVTFPETDDHPDGDTNGDSVFDTGQFAEATEVFLDIIEGSGLETGTLEIPTDSDLFRISPQASGVTTLQVTRPTGSTVRARVTVLSATGVQLAQASMTDVANPTLSLNVDVTRGERYFVVVDSIAPNTATSRTGSYTLLVTAPVADDHPNATEWNIATPIAISQSTGRGGVGVVEAGVPGNPRINPDADTDLFTFTTFLAGDQLVTITPLTTGLGNIAVRLQVFIASNLVTPLATVDGAADAPAVFNITGAAAGTQYFILVSSRDAVSGTTRRGEYAVQVAGPRPDDPIDPIDPSEVDFDNPTQIVLSERTGEGSSVGRTLNSQPSVINPANDRDLYSFVAAGTGRAFVRVWTPQGSLLDAAITIFRRNQNGTRTQVAFDADGIAGSTAYSTFGVRAGETYLVLVDGLGEATGDYVVEVGSSPAVNRLVYPEGFTSDSVFEFVPIVNPNPFPIEYTVRLRYETGSVLETVFPTRTIGANTRDGVSINEGTRRTSDVIAGVGYSIIIDWTIPETNPLTNLPVDPSTVQPLGATLSHYDFGSSTGDAFTSRVSDTWTFARVERNPGAVLDFVLFYNPQSYAVNATLRIFFSDGTSTALDPRRVEGGRRGGFSIDGFTQLGRGIFGATLTAVPADDVLPANLLVEPFEGIVASLTHYSIGSTNTSAFAVLGDGQGGTRAGSVNRFEQGNGITSEITFFNPGINPATVALTSTYQRANLPSFTSNWTVLPGRTLRISGSQLGLQANQPVGLTFTSNVNVTTVSQTQTLGDADAATAITSAGTRFLFGDAYINANTAGRNFFETLSFYNPTNLTNTVAVNLFFFNRPDQPELGNANPARRTINVTIPARGFAELKLHEAAEVINNRGANNSPDIWFGIETTAVQPFAVTMTHYDLVLGGGWGAAGVPVGLATPLNQITFN